MAFECLRRAVVFLFFGGHDITDATNAVDGQNRAISRIKGIRDAFADPEPEKGISRLQVSDFDIATTFEPLDNSNMSLFSGGRELVEFRKYELSANTKQINSIRSPVRDFAAKLLRADLQAWACLPTIGFRRNH
jgi:hypothetical protein